MSCTFKHPVHQILFLERGFALETTDILACCPLQEELMLHWLRCSDLIIQLLVVTNLKRVFFASVSNWLERFLVLTIGFCQDTEFNF